MTLIVVSCFVDNSFAFFIASFTGNTIYDQFRNSGHLVDMVFNAGSLFHYSHFVYICRDMCLLCCQCVCEYKSTHRTSRSSVVLDQSEHLLTSYLPTSFCTLL